MESLLKKVILILSDALRYDAAVQGMGYLGHLVESGFASLYKIVGELPSMSRPMYETIHTGLPSSEHGIVANSVVRLSTKPNVFQSVRDAGRVTAAAAYSWFSELYNRAPYSRIDDRETDDSSLSIQHGRFYSEDAYPDLELFATAGMLVRRFAPDYLLVHPMGMDYQGETFGANPVSIATRPSNRICGWLLSSLNGSILVTLFSSPAITASTRTASTAARPSNSGKCRCTSSELVRKDWATRARLPRTFKLRLQFCRCWKSPFRER